MTDDDSLADSPASRAIRAIDELTKATRAIDELTNNPATRAIDRLFAPPPKPNYSRLLEHLEQEREHKRAYEEAVIQLAQQPAIQPPPEPPPPPPTPRPRKRRESSRSEDWNRWRECGAEINKGREAKGMKPLNKSGLADEVIKMLGLHDAPRTVREKF